MKKIIILVVVMGSFAVSHAQKRFREFIIKDKHGIVDSFGKEIVPPIHKYKTYLVDRNEIVFSNFNDKVKDIIFNTASGEIQSFDYLFTGEVDIKGNSFTLVKNKGKKYLRSQRENKIIMLKKDYYDLSNEGKYIIGRYYAEDPPAPPVKIQKDKNGKWIPPPIMKVPSHASGSYGYDVMTDDEAMKVLMKGVFVSYLPLYADRRKAESNSDGIIGVEVIELKTYKKSNFEAIIFSTGSSHSLYNASMILVKKFELKNPTDELLAAKAAVIMKIDLSQYDKENSLPPSVGMVSPERGSSELREQLKAPPVVYPVFIINKSESGNKQFVIQKSDSDSKVIFETKQAVHLDTEDAIIRITDDKDNDSKFGYNRVTGALYLPQQYWQTIGLMIP